MRSVLPSLVYHRMGVAYSFSGYPSHYYLLSPGCQRRVFRLTKQNEGRIL